MTVFSDAVFLWDPGSASEASSDLVTGASASGAITEGTIVTASGRTGRAYSGAVGSRFASPIANLAPPQDWTMFAVVRFPVTAAVLYALQFALSSDSEQFAGLVAASGSTSQVWLRANNSTVPGADDWPQVTVPDQTAPTGFVLVMARFVASSATVGTLEGYVDSSTALGSDGFNDADDSAADRLTVGRLEDSSPGNSTGGQVYAAGVWSRALSSGELAEVVSDPFRYLIGEKYLYDHAASNRPLTRSKRGV